MSGTPSSSRLTTQELDYVETTGDVSVTASSAATAQTIVTASALTFDGATPVLIEYFCHAGSTSTTSASSLVLNLFDGSTDLGRLAQLRTPAAAVVIAPLYICRRLTPSAASHTYSVRVWSSAGTGGIDNGAGGTDTALPGFIRISRVGT